MTATTTPASAKEAQKMLTDMKMPIFALDVLARISQEEGEPFRSNIASAAAGDRNARDYLVTVLTAYSPVTGNAIRRLGFEPPSPQALLPVIRQEGRPARAALKAIVESPADQEAAGFLRTMFLQMGLRSVRSADLAPGNDSTPPMQAKNNVTPHPAADRDQPVDEPYTGEPPPDAAQHNRPEIESTHLYGGKAAFCFTKDRTRTGQHPTVTIDAARAIPGAERRYDWKNKIVFQLTVGELPLVYGVFYGHLKELRLVGHGTANNKSLSIEDQEDKYFLSMGYGSESPVAIPAYAKDTFRVMTILLEQIKANSPGLSTGDLMRIIQRVCEKHVNPPKRQARAQNA